MDEKTMDNGREIEIDLQRLSHAVLTKAWLIAVVSIVCAVATYVGMLLLVTPTYQSSIMFYVNNSSSSQDSGNNSVTNADLTASRSLVKSYIIILNTKETLNEVIKEAGLELTHHQVKDMISADAVESTEIVRITITSPDPNEAEKLANAIAAILPTHINRIIDGTSARIVETADVAQRPSSPNYMQNTVLGFVISLVLMLAIVLLREIFDTTVRSEEDVDVSVDKPILGLVPDMLSQSKGGYGKKNVIESAKAGAYGKKTVGPQLSFAAAEAYKLLRTKLQFSFTDEEKCHIVGVSSSMAGEGKSLTSVNLAYSLSQMGLRVLLIDCDMRRPSLADKLPVQKYPGLSDYLSGQTSAEHLIQLCGIKDEENAFHVISAGRLPPNPMELLGSNKMERTLNQLRANYDYILLDLPPVCEVGDALVIAKMTDGTLLVVRQDYCNRRALRATIRQFNFVGAKILGVVLNCAKENPTAYGKEYYKKYSNQYHKGCTGIQTSSGMKREKHDSEQR